MNKNIGIQIPEVPNFQKRQNNINTVVKLQITKGVLKRTREKRFFSHGTIINLTDS